MDRLIGRILELSKLDLKQDTSYSEVFSPVQLFKDAFDRYNSTLKTKKIDLHLDLSGDARILGNRDAFGTVINNLLDNACRYSPVNGNVHLLSRIVNQTIEITVANSSSEIPESDLTRIFDPFFRMDHQENSSGGLGLAISKRIIEKHRGSIKATNSEKGLELIITVPTVKVE